MSSSSIGSVGVIIPNYNYARYLPERISSIVAQGSSVGAMAFLDDGSSDASIAVAEPLLANLSFPVHLQCNPVNSGSVLRQWARGISHLDRPFLWIAEADDSARPGMLRALVERLSADPSASFAFCDSTAIDAEGAILEESTKPYAAALGDHILDNDVSLPGAEFTRRCLCPRNLVVNVSAVLWRAEALRSTLERLGKELDRWSCTCDWRVYVDAALTGGRIHYDARSLNLHRRHLSSLTKAVSRAKHFAEVVEMMTVLRGALGRRTSQDARMRQHLVDLKREWQLA
ncbi:glycosyltransferase [Roseomonas chloroacetimidivorans]|uniref:glycosyltransferase n=1 Tax=Roseomonas chloroacetimidivorans TaxID=1766656 RepID=UPI003C7537BD